MAKVYPFNPYVYNLNKVPDLSSVVTQPYDKISQEMQEKYYALSPHNLVRIIRGKSFAEDSSTNNAYTRALQTYKHWLGEDILSPVREPAFYAYFQEYMIPGAALEKRVRKGFIGLGKLEDYSAEIVYPHERTLAAPKADRLRLLSTTRTHFEPIFMLYTDPRRVIDEMLDEAAQAPPMLRAIDEYGVQHTLWAINDPRRVSRIESVMSDKKLIIADGHHRYETALAYRNERREENSSRTTFEEAPYERMMISFFNTENAGLTILPTHRLILNLSSFDIDRFIEDAHAFFSIRQYGLHNEDEKSAQLRNFQTDLATFGKEPPKIGCYMTGQQSFCLFRLREDVDLERHVADVSPRQRTLDVVLLHHLLLKKCLGITDEAITTEKNVEYLREFELGVNKIDSGAGQLCFFLNPTRLEQVREIALAGETLPQKSTDFYPKLLSGLTIYRLEEEAFK